VPPVVVENASEFEETPSVAFGRTVNVTETFCGLLATFVGEVAVRVTVPVYVPTCRALGFAVMLRFAGEVAMVGLTSNQFPPVLVVPATLKVIGVPSVLATDTVWNPVLTAPAGTEKLTPPGLTKNREVALTTSVTGIVCAGLLGVAGVTVIVPA
jgi:hypothetical protein